MLTIKRNLIDMAKDLHSYFTAKENQSQPAIPEFVTSLSGNVSRAELTLVSEEIKKTSNLENITINIFYSSIT